MPIKLENKKRYPSNWYTEIRPAILRRAQDRCEFCGIPNHAVGYRDKGRFFFLEDDKSLGVISQYKKNLTWKPISYGKAKEITREFNTCPGGRDFSGRKWIVTVLTIAHLDHQPENCHPDNLRALCQRCHLVLDAGLHRVNAQITRRAKKACGDLFSDG